MLSAFSNWSAHGHFASATVGWLGLNTFPGIAFLPQLTHTIIVPASAADCVETSRLCGTSSPFAVSTKHQFVNEGESVFRISDTARELGCVRLTDGLPFMDDGVPDDHFEPESLTTLCFFPPGKMATGKGRVLVCSNYHWLADVSYWNGGKIRRGDNSRILLNFLAAAVAARVDPWRS